MKKLTEYLMPPVVFALLVMVVESSLANNQAPSDLSEYRADFDSVLVQLYAAASLEKWVLKVAESDGVRAVYRPRMDSRRKVGGGSDLVITSIDDPPWMYYCLDCITYLNSELPVTDFEAVEIARKAGLEIGVKPWRISRHWYHGVLQRHVWTVENTLGIETTPGSERAWGEVVVIDAASGDILKKDGGWVSIGCGLVDSMRSRN